MLGLPFLAPDKIGASIPKVEEDVKIRVGSQAWLWYTEAIDKVR